MRASFLLRASCVLALCGAALQAQATDLSAVADLAKASGWYSCHSNGEKVVGPAFSAIAAKYAGQKDAAADLAMSIQGGSSGKWGRIPMPGHPSVPPADVKRLAEWVLTIKP